MFQVFRNAWMDTQLRKKILYTLFIIVLFRLGSNIFVPFLDNSAISTMMGGASLLNHHASAADGLCRPIILYDVCLNSKGYERLTERMSKKHEQ